MANLTLIAGVYVWLTALSACLIALIWARTSPLARSLAAFASTAQVRVHTSASLPQPGQAFKLSVSRLDL